MAWRCSKCGNANGGTNKPLVGVCTKGGGHRWGAVPGGSASSSYRCGKCGNTTMSHGKPLDRNCSQGGRCSWRKQG
jgi:DNA-directed RNA polymerase subunit RPC12/RpoP